MNKKEKKETLLKDKVKKKIFHVVFCMSATVLQTILAWSKTRTAKEEKKMIFFFLLHLDQKKKKEKKKRKKVEKIRRKKEKEGQMVRCDWVVAWRPGYAFFKAYHRVTLFFFWGGEIKEWTNTIF